MHTGNSSLVLMMGGAMADASNRDGSMTNNFYAPVGNVAGSAQDDASQNYNVGGEAIAPTQGNGKLVQADGEGLLRSLLGPAASELGQMAGIQAYFWKMDLLQACLEKAAEKMQRLGIEPKQVKGKFLKPLLEGAAMEDEPELQELWANLLASAAVDGEIHPSFADILSKLAAADAQCLQEFDRRGLPASPDGSDNQASLDNLVRLGLCQKQMRLQNKAQTKLGSLAGPLWRIASGTTAGGVVGFARNEPYLLMERYVVTDLGHRFLEAVQGPQISA